MKLELITLLGQKMDEDIYELILPTSLGDIAVFPGHESLVTLAVPGVMAVRKHKTDGDDRLQYFATSGGIAEISGERVRVLVDEAEAGDDIVEAESRAALERAMELRGKALDQVDIERAQAMIDRHTVRLKVAGLRRRHH